MASSRSPVDLLASGLHVWPDFHGNRSPLADPSLKGMVREHESEASRVFSHDILLIKAQGLKFIYRTTTYRGEVVVADPC